VFFIPNSIGDIYEALKRYGATMVVSGSTGEMRHFEATERSLINKKMGFKVSWPSGWVEDRGLEHTVIRQMGWPLNIYTATIIIPEKAGVLLPKISIVVENVGDIDIISYAQKRLNMWKTQEIEALGYDAEVCKDFNTVTEILFYKPAQDLERYQIQKSFLRNNKAYVFNIFDLYLENIKKKPGLTTDIIEIVRSFTFLESTKLSR